MCGLSLAWALIVLFTWPDRCELRWRDFRDIFWLKDDSLEDIDSLPAPVVLAAQI